METARHRKKERVGGWPKGDGKKKKRAIKKMKEDEKICLADPTRKRKRIPAWLDFQSNFHPRC